MTSPRHAFDDASLVGTLGSGAPASGFRPPRWPRTLSVVAGTIILATVAVYDESLTGLRYLVPTDRRHNEALVNAVCASAECSLDTFESTSIHPRWLLDDG